MEAGDKVSGNSEMMIDEYVKMIEEYCREKKKYGIKRVFTVRWLIKIFNIPENEKSALLTAIRRMHAEGKIRKRSSRTWEWNN